MNLVEYTILEGQADETNVFRNVKILGLKSANGYSYDPKAVEKAKHLYENAPVYLDHAKGSRSYKDRLGYIQNPTIIDHELFADFVLNPKSIYSEQILWDAQHGTSGVGFSHSIDGTLNKKTNLVESILKVFSVDFVASPACVRSIFENLQQEQNVIEEMTKTAQEASKITAVMMEEIESLKKQIVEIKQSIKPKPQAIIPTAEPVKETSYADFLKKIKR